MTPLTPGSRFPYDRAGRSGPPLRAEATLLRLRVTHAGGAERVTNPATRENHLRNQIGRLASETGVDDRIRAKQGESRVFPVLRMLVASMALCFTLSQSALGSTRDGAWRDDLRFLTSELASRHPSLFHHVARETFEAAAAQLDNDIPQLTDEDVIVRMMGIVALVGDAHTTFSLLSIPGFRWFPLRLYWFPDGLYVIGTTAASASAAGLRVVEIDGIPVDRVAELVAGVVSYENQPWLLASSPIYLASREVLAALGIARGDSARWVFARPDGSRLELDLTALPAQESLAIVYSGEAVTTDTPLYRRHPELNYWFESLPEYRALYFRYNHCNEQPGRPAAAFARELRAAWDSAQPDRIVLDFRDNGGGDSAVLSRLLAGLASLPDIFAQPGRVLLLVNRGTFSSALLNALDVQRAGTSVVVAGEATGGKPNHYGFPASFSLPNSRLKVYCSSRYFPMVEGDPPSLFPDLPVLPTASDYFENRDPVLRRVLNRPPTALILQPGAEAVAAPGSDAVFLGRADDVDPNEALTVRWDFGDGNGATGGESVSHRYATEGSFEVTLSVTDSQGAVARDVRRITVRNPRGVPRRRLH